LAWISFVGRIIAQIIGAAAASILFGVLILHKYQGGAEKPSKAHASQPAAAEDRPAPARARRSADDVALAVLPLENFSGDAQQDAFADAMTEALQSLKSEVRSLR
jgi:glycerol uptake facilitator-like aquaporin